MNMFYEAQKAGIVHYIYQFFTVMYLSKFEITPPFGFDRLRTNRINAKTKWIKLCTRKLKSNFAFHLLKILDKNFVFQKRKYMKWMN